jgi:hypothetical protein
MGGTEPRSEPVDLGWRSDEKLAPLRAAGQAVISARVPVPVAPDPLCSKLG